MTPEEQLAECAERKNKTKRKKRDMYYYVACFVIAFVAFAMARIALVGRL